MNKIAESVCDLLENKQTLVLATIISHSGSTPRTSGSKMIVTADGRGIGTIGGGLIEARAMSQAVTLIDSGQSAVMPFDLSYDIVSTLDMICGGKAEVLLDCVTPTEANRAIFNQWRELLAEGGNGALLTMVRMDKDTIEEVSHGLVTARGGIEGDMPLSEIERDKVAAVVSSSGAHTLPVAGGFVVVEPAGRRCGAHLFGAGHVAQPTAQLASMVGFEVTVADDREEFANGERFPGAGRIRVLESFEKSFADLAIDRNDYVIILTRGHLHDRTVLAQALKTDAGYIGMIGSRSKRNAIYKMLLKDGYTQADLDRVYSPIGISIAAETPEEIAVSIVGEMIKHRAEDRS